jgi:SAM-dependent methyltransferase/uncharacterized protein YbaR (Trm112 family)
LRLRHFEAIRPICPVCRREGRPDARLEVAAVLRRDGDGAIAEGILHCPLATCRREYPIVDGIPLLLGPLRGFIADNALAFLARADLAEPIESLFADCCGPASPLVTARQQVSSYAWDHWADLDPAEREGAAPGSGEAGDVGPRPGSALRVLERGLALAGPAPAGPALDLGCATGRTTFALAERTGGLALGVDLHVPMLRVAAAALGRGEVVYPRRRVGVVHDRRRFAVALPRRDDVDFWLADAHALPFADATFTLVASLNVIDCAGSPRDVVASVARVLAPGGRAVISTPYDWSAAATPIEGWLGGHSQRGPAAGASEPALRALLTPGGPTSVPGLEWLAEGDLPWHVRMHDRSVVAYSTHVVAAARR